MQETSVAKNEGRKGGTKQRRKAEGRKERRKVAMEKGGRSTDT